MAMELVMRHVKPLTRDDVHVVQRMNAHGVWFMEVWTKKRFEAETLRIVPWTTEIKERH